MLNVVYADCCKYALYAECHYAAFHNAVRHYTECRYAECNGAYFKNKT